jgi:hypothetical protein
VQTLFAVYCGFIYNDVFAQGTNVFGSKFSWVHGQSEAKRVGTPAVTVTAWPVMCPSVIGVVSYLCRHLGVRCVPVRR